MLKNILLLFIGLSTIFFFTMNRSLYIIGIDGGATKTTATLCAFDTTILAEAQGESSNIQMVGVEHAAEIVLALVHQCCHTVGCTISEIGAIVAGIAGVGRAADQQQLFDAIAALAQKKQLPFPPLGIESDARIALEGAFSGKPGIIVIAGTGSIVLGSDANGAVHRSGGWGRSIGDEGSGYAIGREAFRVVAKVLDGSKIKTRLTKLFAHQLQFNSQEAIIQAVYRNNFDLASVVPLVLEAAAANDAVAKNILTHAALELIETIALTANSFPTPNKERIPLSFAGSLLTNDNFYSRKVRATLKRTLPQLSPHMAEASPVIGAVLMAKDLAGAL
ncbi:MAG TPA: BadF/BadG/BcrA/BcrD ATPase family protein [Bacteroidota bacterium]|nr:BadF/BadG/BcrA/BcrD ATPase family protein [Bacteroidota bacterium]